MVMFPCDCYILKETEKAYLVRMFEEWDKEDTAVIWVMKKAIYQEDMKGYSESNYPVKRIYVKGWFKPIAKKRIDEYFEYLDKRNGITD